MLRLGAALSWVVEYDMSSRFRLDTPMNTIAWAVDGSVYIRVEVSSYMFPLLSHRSTRSGVGDERMIPTTIVSTNKDKGLPTSTARSHPLIWLDHETCCQRISGGMDSRSCWILELINRLSEYSISELICSW